MKNIIIAVTILISSYPVIAKQGVISGGETYTIPGWFKLSLLDIKEDASDAAKSRKHLMLFMHLKACPYCARMLDENYRTGRNKVYVQKYFDVVAINIRGDKEVTWKGDKVLSEMSFSQAIGVFATPTIVFLNSNGKEILKINGYRKPEAFRTVLEFVANKHYRNMSLPQFVKRRKTKATYKLVAHRYIKNIRNLTAYKNPLMIIFENRNCADCIEFHKKVLNHSDVLLGLKKYLLIRLDTNSLIKVVTPSGEKLPPGLWAKKLGLNYTPGIALFDNGKLVSLVNGRLYHFHFKEILRYVSEGYYMRFHSFSHYLSVRQKELLRQGIDIDLSE